MERFREMTTFVKVVEAQGFAAAAVELGISTAAVSKHVQSLEARLGARLITRTTRRFALTEAGTVFFEKSKAILSEVEAAEFAVKGLNEEPLGTLRVNAPQDFTRLHLTEAFAEFVSRYPRITVELTLTDRIVNVVDEGVDVAVRIARPADSTLVARKLAPCRQVLCAAPRYLERHGRPDKPEELRARNCLQYEYLTFSNGWPFRASNRKRVIHVSGRFKTNSGSAMRDMALAGHGIALLPTFLVGNDLREGRLEQVLPGLLDADTDIFALYAGRRHLPAKVRVFVDFLAAHCKTSGNRKPYWDRGIKGI